MTCRNLSSQYGIGCLALVVMTHFSAWLQVVQHIQGRKAEQEEGDGHWAPVLALDSHKKLPLMATGANEPDNSIKLWSYEE